MKLSKKYIIVFIIGIFLIILPIINFSDTSQDENETNPPTEIHTSDSILEGVLQCYAEGVSTLVVEAGDYDIIEEYKAYYGDDYFDNYQHYWGDNLFDRGIWLEYIEVRFAKGAKVTCHYTGDNENVSSYFCPFSIGNNVLIDGLVLESSNVRYGIHPDFNTGIQTTTLTLRNCDLKHSNPDGNQQAIGAGLGCHVDWLFENCIFRSSLETPVVRIHNNAAPDAQSNVEFRDCFIDGPGIFYFTSYGPSTLKSTFLVNNCSYINAPVVGVEFANMDGSLPDNIYLMEFNNTIR